MSGCAPSPATVSRRQMSLRWWRGGAVPSRGSAPRPVTGAMPWSPAASGLSPVVRDRTEPVEQTEGPGDRTRPATHRIPVTEVALRRLDSLDDEPLPKAECMLVELANEDPVLARPQIVEQATDRKAAEPRPWEACHPGIDIAAPTGTPIRAADGGRVAIAGWTGGYGNYTCIQHSASLSSCYGHQSSIGVSVGQQVSKGQVIGAVGSTGHSTGPHLHFEVRINGAVTNPLNYL